MNNGCSIKYLVGLLCGGLMEDPKVTFSEPYNIIEANSKEEAREIYNKINKCDYFYGSVMCIINDNDIEDINHYCSYNDCLRALKTTNYNIKDEKI